MAMYDLYYESDVKTDLSTVTAALVGKDVDAKLAAFAGVASHLDGEEDPSAFLTVVTAPPREDASWMLTCCARVLPHGDLPSALHRLSWEAASYLYFSATVTEFFTNDLDPEDMRHGVETGDGSIGSLATARQLMSIDPRVSWRLLTDFRRHWELPTIERPLTRREGDPPAS